MTPIDKFLEWFNGQDIPTRDTVAFQVLHFASDFDLTKEKSFINISEIFKQYIANDMTPRKNIGKILYVKSAIDFIVANYDSVDDFIDSQNMHKKVIQEGEKDGNNMEILKKSYSEGADRFTLRKQFKENWTTFCNEYLNFETLNKYVLNDFLSGLK